MKDYCCIHLKDLDLNGYIHSDNDGSLLGITISNDSDENDLEYYTIQYCPFCGTTLNDSE